MASSLPPPYGSQTSHHDISIINAPGSGDFIKNVTTGHPRPTLLCSSWWQHAQVRSRHLQRARPANTHWGLHTGPEAAGSSRWPSTTGTLPSLSPAPCISRSLGSEHLPQEDRLRPDRRGLCAHLRLAQQQCTLAGQSRGQMKRHWGDSAGSLWTLPSHPVNKAPKAASTRCVQDRRHWHCACETWNGGHLCPHQCHPSSSLWRCPTIGWPVRGPAW